MLAVINQKSPYYRYVQYYNTLHETSVSRPTKIFVGPAASPRAEQSDLSMDPQEYSGALTQEQSLEITHVRVPPWFGNHQEINSRVK